MLEMASTSAPGATACTDDQLDALVHRKRAVLSMLKEAITHQHDKGMASANLWNSAYQIFQAGGQCLVKMETKILKTWLSSFGPASAVLIGTGIGSGTIADLEGEVNALLGFSAPSGSNPATVNDSCAAKFFKFACSIGTFAVGKYGPYKQMIKADVKSRQDFTSSGGTAGLSSPVTTFRLKEGGPVGQGLLAAKEACKNIKDFTELTTEGVNIIQALSDSVNSGSCSGIPTSDARMQVLIKLRQYSEACERYANFGNP